MTNELPTIGKISPEIFDELILPRLGAANPAVLVPPQHGVDVGIVRLAPGLVMAITTDPVFIVPAYGWERAAWFAVHILASDAATSGLAPTYMTIDLNLPMSITKDDLTLMWNTIHRECDALGISIISGHTARYEGTDYPMVGGATVISIGPEDKYVTPKMARSGDVVIVTKGAAIEATGLFGVTFPQMIEDKLGKDIAAGAGDLFYQMSVVKDALVAASVGVRDDGVTAMHDATEGGVWGGLYEIAQASGVGMHIDRSKVLVRDEVRAVCDLFDMDPYAAISEGTLLLTCRPHKADAVISALKAEAIQASIVGEVLPQERGMSMSTPAGDQPLVHPRVDPFWAAFGKAMAEQQA